MIIDSFAWIEFLGGTSLEPAVREQLAAADVVLTPDLALAEVARKSARDGVSRQLASRKLQDISPLSQVPPVNLEIALGVSDSDAALRNNAKIRGIERPGLAGAVILSKTRVFKGKVLTGDSHFQGLTETVWLGT